MGLPVPEDVGLINMSNLSTPSGDRAATPAAGFVSPYRTSPTPYR